VGKIVKKYFFAVQKTTPWGLRQNFDLKLVVGLHENDKFY
jgi:hypothetical protein